MVSNLGVRPAEDSESEAKPTFHPTKGRGLFHRWMKRFQAAALGLVIGIGTVKSHVHSILGKLEARDRTQAVIKAQELKLV